MLPSTIYAARSTYAGETRSDGFIHRAGRIKKLALCSNLLRNLGLTFRGVGTFDYVLNFFPEIGLVDQKKLKPV
jgi:hypothetical protein